MVAIQNICLDHFIFGMGLNVDLVPEFNNVLTDVVKVSYSIVISDPRKFPIVRKPGPIFSSPEPKASGELIV